MIRVDQRWSRRSRPGRSTPWARIRSRSAHITVCRYVVPVLGKPMWRKTFAAMVPSRLPLLASEAALEIGERSLDLVRVLGGDGQQQLLHEVDELGDPEVEVAVLLHGLLELVDAAQQLLDQAAADDVDHPAAQPRRRPLAHLCHCATNRAKGRPGSPGSPSTDVSSR